MKTVRPTPSRICPHTAPSTNQGPDNPVAPDTLAAQDANNLTFSRSVPTTDALRPPSSSRVPTVASEPVSVAEIYSQGPRGPLEVRRERQIQAGLIGFAIGSWPGAMTFAIGSVLNPVGWPAIAGLGAYYVATSAACLVSVQFIRAPQLPEDRSSISGNLFNWLGQHGIIIANQVSVPVQIEQLEDCLAMRAHSLFNWMTYDELALLTETLNASFIRNSSKEYRPEPIDSALRHFVNTLRQD